MHTWCILNNLAVTKSVKLPQNFKFNHVQLIVLFTPTYWVLNKIRKKYIIEDSCYLKKNFCYNKYHCIKNNIAPEADTLIIEMFKIPQSLNVDVYEHVYVHASVYVLTAARASLPCLPLTVLRVMLMMNTVLMRWAVSSHLINRAMRKSRKERLRKMYREYEKYVYRGSWEKKKYEY